MKCAIGVFSVLGLILILVFCSMQTNLNNDEYLRIHIRANSNEEIDQNIKYQIKDAVVEALVPIVANADTKEKAEILMQQNFPLIEKVANEILKEEGFSYVCRAKLAREEFPTRVYENLTLESGFYDALILELGEAKGNNWWCVVYPPFCFLQTGEKNVVYKSKIWDIIQSVINN